MKRLILSLMFVFVQSGFALSDAEWDKLIANQPSEVWKQIYRCNKVTLNHQFTGDVNECLKAIELMKKVKWSDDKGFAIMFLNAGVLYHYSKKNYLKAYEYYIKSAKLGEQQAQENLDILCKEHPWVCK